MEGTNESVASRRLKMLACTFLGLSVLAAVGTGGYFTYKKVSVSVQNRRQINHINFILY